MQTKQHSKHINYNRSLLFSLFRIQSLPPLLFPLIFHLIKSNQHHMWKMCLNVETAEKTKSKSQSIFFCTRQKFSNNSLYCIVLYPIVNYWKRRYLFFTFDQNFPCIGQTELGSCNKYVKGSYYKFLHQLYRFNENPYHQAKEDVIKLLFAKKEIIELVSTK